MTRQQFLIFVADLAFCLSMFCYRMETRPTTNPWTLLGMFSILVVAFILLYVAVNTLLKHLEELAGK
jgi:competence protein ComGC